MKGPVAAIVVDVETAGGWTGEGPAEDFGGNAWGLGNDRQRWNGAQVERIGRDSHVAVILP